MTSDVSYLRKTSQVGIGEPRLTQSLLTRRSVLVKGGYNLELVGPFGRIWVVTHTELADALILTWLPALLASPHSLAILIALMRAMSIWSSITPLAGQSVLSLSMHANAGKLRDR